MKLESINKQRIILSISDNGIKAKYIVWREPSGIFTYQLIKYKNNEIYYERTYILGKIPKTQKETFEELERKLINFNNPQQTEENKMQKSNMEQYTRETSNGWKIVLDMVDPFTNRRNVIVKRKFDYAVGFGYDASIGQWNHGHYDFETFEDAKKDLFDN